MFDTIIVSGGNIQSGFALDFLRKIITETGRENIRLVAADKGLEFFMETGIRPDMAVGDFDSLSVAGQEYLSREKEIQIIRLKPEKDDSDTQSALHHAADCGAKNVLLLGATGTRLDHVFANVELLSLAKKQGISVTLADANNYMMLVEFGTVLKKEEQFGKYVSFFPVGGDVTGLTLEGFKYPLCRHHLQVCDCGLTVSNEIKEKTARITFDSGELLMIMSRD